MRDQKSFSIPTARRALAALTAAALLAALLTGCAGRPAGGAASSESSSAAADTAQPSPTPTAAPARMYPPGPQPGFEALPPDACFTLIWSNADTLQRESQLLQGGEKIPGTGFWVIDAATGKAAARAECSTETGEEHYFLYDLAGDLLLDCGPMRPYWILGHYGFLGGNWSDEQIVDLATGEIWQDHCSLAGQVSEGIWMVTGIPTAGAPTPAPMLVNGQMEVLRRFDGATDGRPETPNLEESTGLVWFFAQGETGPEYRLYGFARDEIFPGQYQGLVAGDAPRGRFAIGQEEFLVRLDTGEKQRIPQNGTMRRRYTAVTSEASAYNLLKENGDYVGSYLETADGLLAGTEIELMPCGWYLRRRNGTALLLDPAGRQQETLAFGTVHHSVGWPSPTFSVLYWGGGWRLYNAGGLCAEGSDGYAVLTSLGGGRYALVTWQDGEDAACALLSTEGKLLIEGLDEIEATEVPGIWSVRRGDSAGLMDEAGNWLWIESAYTLAAAQRPAPPEITD